MTRNTKQEIYRQWKLLKPSTDAEERAFFHGWDITQDQLSKIIKDGDAASLR